MWRALLVGLALVGGCETAADKDAPDGGTLDALVDDAARADGAPDDPADATSTPDGPDAAADALTDATPPAPPDAAADADPVVDATPADAAIPDDASTPDAAGPDASAPDDAAAPDDASAPDATTPADAAAPDMGAGARLELGTGTAQFEPVADGQLLSIYRGPQGGFHFWGSLRATGVDPGTFEGNRLTRMQFTVDRVADDEEVARATFDDILEPGPDDAYEYLAVPIIFDAVRFQNPQFFDGELMRIELVFTDANGLILRDEVEVEASCCLNIGER